VQEVLGWSEDRVQRGVAAFRTLRTLGGQVTDVPGAFVAVMLHTDAVLAAAAQERDAAACFHLVTAARMVEYVSYMVPDTRRHPFSRGTWYVNVTRALNGLWGWNVEESLLKELAQVMGVGSVSEASERVVSSVEQEQPGVGSQLMLAVASLEDGTAQTDRRERDFAEPARRHDSLNRARVQQAEHFYQRALEMDPTLLEGRLRLGALLVETGSPSAAQIELRQVLSETKDARQIYLAYLFLGQIEEQAGRIDQAVGLYLRALAAWPQSQVARIALGNAQEKSGDVAAAHALIVSFFGRPMSGREQDPWSGYLAGQKDEGIRTLDEMRTKAISSR